MPFATPKFKRMQHDRNSRTASDQRVAISATSDVANAGAVACEAVLRRVGVLIDAELATGKHDGLLKLD